MVLLINPKTSKPTEFNTSYFREPNSGLLYLAAILDINDINVELLDLEQFLAVSENRKREIIIHASRGHKIIGITCLTNTFYKARNIAMHIKSEFPEKYIVMGGPHVSFLYDNILKRDYETEKVIDLICIGEAEYNFLRLTEVLLNSRSNENKISEIEGRIKNVKQIAYINERGKVIYTGADKEIINLNNLPMPARYKLSPINYYYSVANVIVNRGCPNQCSFCSRQDLFKSTRIRNIPSIIDELRDIDSSQMYEFVNFYDNINLKKGLLRDLAYTLILNDFSLPWGCELRVDNITAQEARLMKDAGCRVIATGIESASKKVLERNFKYQDPQKVKGGLQFLKDCGIAVQAYFVLGLPGETKKTFQKTIDYIKGLPLTDNDTVNFFIATPYPGSKLWKEQDSFGIKIFEYDFSKYDCEHIIFETQELDKAELEKMAKRGKAIEKKFGGTESPSV